jgi:hypothetical protein
MFMGVYKKLQSLTGKNGADVEVHNSEYGPLIAARSPIYWNWYGGKVYKPGELLPLTIHTSRDRYGNVIGGWGCGHIRPDESSDYLKFMQGDSYRKKWTPQRGNLIL